MKDLRIFETESEYINEKASFEYPQVSYTKDNGKVWVKEASYVIAKYKASPEELSRNELINNSLVYCGLYKPIFDIESGEIISQEKPEIVEQSILLSYDEVNNISTYKFILKDEYEEYDFSTAFGGVFLGSGSIDTTLNYLDLSNVKKPIINLDIKNILDVIILNDNLKSINEFGLPGMIFKNDFVLPSSLEFIGNNAFMASYCNVNMFSNVQHLNPQENEYWGATIVDEITEDGLCIKDNKIIKCKINSTNVTIPNSVTSIGDNAFYYCRSLTSITIPNSVTSIGGYAFSSCDGLTSIEIPSSVTSIGSNAFRDCYFTSFINNSRLTSSTNWGATIVDEITEDGLCIKNNKIIKCKDNSTNITIPNSVTSIGNSAFKYCRSLTSIIIPNGVITIGSYAFYYCDSLTSITFEENSQLTSIGDNAFSICSLKSIEIPSGVTSIGEWAFSGCTNLTSIEIPSSVTSIGGYAFRDCYFTSFINNSRLTSSDNWGATIVDEITEDGLYIKNNEIVKCKSNATNVTIPNYVTSIGNNAFQNCNNLTSIIIPNGVITIGSYAFNYCSKLTSITFEENSQLTSIGDNAFSICSLKSIEIPSGVTSIGDNAFDSCRRLTSVTIPNSVTSIGGYAFDNCYSLTSIEIPSSVTSIGSNAFNGCMLNVDNFINNSSLDVETNEYWGAIVYDRISEDGNYFRGNVFVKVNSDIKKIVIPNNIVKIGNNAFSGYTSVTSVTFEEGSQLTSIGDNAFYDCDTLEIIEIPSGVTSIGTSVFERCYSLSSIEIPSGVTSIGNDAFYYCRSLTSVTFEEGSQLTSIGDNAFYLCESLTSITIPSGVTSIGSFAFYCESLNEVVCYAIVAPNIGNNVFSGVKSNGKLKVPQGSDYSSWMGISYGNLGYAKWTIEYI